MTVADLTVYHDGSCPLCRLEIEHYRRQEGSHRISFVDVSDATTLVGADLTREKALGKFHVRLPSGVLKSGASAFIEIWKVLPKWRLAARLASLPGVTGALNAGYTTFTAIRPVIAKIVLRLGLA